MGIGALSHANPIISFFYCSIKRYPLPSGLTLKTDSRIHSLSLIRLYPLPSGLKTNRKQSPRCRISKKEKQIKETGRKNPLKDNPIISSIYCSIKRYPLPSGLTLKTDSSIHSLPLIRLYPLPSGLNPNRKQVQRYRM